MATIVRKMHETHPIHTDAEKEERNEKVELKLEWCGCGSMITQRARKLQESNPNAKKLCFNCLVHSRKIGVAKRKKDGWGT